LKGGKRAGNAPLLPARHITDAKAGRERQAALAGYRIADEIRKCVK